MCDRELVVAHTLFLESHDLHFRFVVKKRLWTSWTHFSSPSELDDVDIFFLAPWTSSRFIDTSDPERGVFLRSLDPFRRVRSIGRRQRPS